MTYSDWSSAAETATGEVDVTENVTLVFGAIVRQATETARPLDDRTPSAVFLHQFNRTPAFLCVAQRLLCTLECLLGEGHARSVKLLPRMPYN